jgi:signal recognition particle receptor subunit beta
MVVFNYSSRELTTKVVYYGPGLCGKTTNLQFIYDSMPPGVKGKMLSLATKSDRTLFFDFLPIDLGEIGGMKTKVQLYTVPGQVFYNETRRLVLKGADGVVFVADSQEDMMDANKDSFRNLEENLQGHGLELASMPHVLQFNKRDLPNALGVDALNAALNSYNVPFYEAVATQGIGVQETLRHITKLVLVHLNERYGEKRRKSRTSASPSEEPRQQEPASQAPPQATPVSEGPPPAPEPSAPQAQADSGVSEHEAEADVSAGLGFAFGDEPEPAPATEEPPLAMPAEPEPEPEQPAQVDPEAELDFAFGDEPEPAPATEEPPLAMPAEPEQPVTSSREAALPEEEAPLAMPGGPEPELERGADDSFEDVAAADDAPPAGEPRPAAEPDFEPEPAPPGGAEPGPFEPTGGDPLGTVGPDPGGHGEPWPQGPPDPPAPPPFETSFETPQAPAHATARAGEELDPGDEHPLAGEPAAPDSRSAPAASAMPLDTDDILGVGESLADASVAVAVEQEPEVQDVFRVAPAVGIGSTQQIDRSELNEAFGSGAPDRAGGIAAEAHATEVDAADPLFAEPGVEPTRLSPGAAQEILVPLELEVAGEIHRYRLVLKLQLDR